MMYDGTNAAAGAERPDSFTDMNVTTATLCREDRQNGEWCGETGSH